MGGCGEVVEWEGGTASEDRRGGAFGWGVGVSLLVASVVPALKMDVVGHLMGGGGALMGFQGCSAGENGRWWAFGCGGGLRFLVARDLQQARMVVGAHLFAWRGRVMRYRRSVRVGSFQAVGALVAS